jgi:hypothetical protein
LQLQVQPSTQGTTDKVSTCFSSTESEGYTGDETTITSGTCAEIGTDGSVKLSVYKGGVADVKLSQNFQVQESAQVGANFTYSPDGTLHLSVYSKTSVEFTVLGILKATWSSSVTIDVMKMISSPGAFFTLSWLKVKFSLCIGGFCPPIPGKAALIAGIIGGVVGALALWKFFRARSGKSKSGQGGIEMT